MAVSSKIFEPMKFVDRQLVEKDKEYGGGSFSLSDSLKMGGTGSTRILYKGGCGEVDRTDRRIAGEYTFASFEVLKMGLIVNYNRNNNQFCQIFRPEDVKQILLTGYRIRVRIKKLGLYRTTKIVHRGILLITTEGKLIEYEVPTRKYNEIKSFMKRITAHKFVSRISHDPVEEDYGSALAGLDI